MCRAMEAMRNEAKEEGIQEGIKEGERKEQLALIDRMLAAGKYSYEEIAMLSRLAIEDVVQMAGAGMQLQ